MQRKLSSSYKMLLQLPQTVREHFLVHPIDFLKFMKDFLNFFNQATSTTRTQVLTEEYRFERQSSWKKFKKSVKNTLAGQVFF